MISSISVESESQISLIPEWKPATWDDYLAYRDDPTIERVKLFFYHNQLLAEMGGEGINHSKFADLLIMMLFVWFTQHPEQVFCSFSRCQIEKPKTKAGAPDLVLYIGDNYPRWEEGEKRYINLEYHRIPNLVGEVADTTLATDLDEKKHLYAELGIPEYWVIDVRGKRVIAFILQDNNTYKEIETSVALSNLPIKLVEQTIKKLEQESNVNAANWFAQQIKNL
ncbi:Uma2 family endonuclease [Aphanothece hegewaldii CCALA 016]|uniref:Uma2 family endonuclease n=1 Tax=Aphanothece hegewaldii CCALA 016 TaxID=2107694 RepID=A0A2T1LTM7_9CHRO|nr:Uma2 family endonuclease [Aphanothece hegewaldii]PSF34261.1 Uma2 family endonuclease [Aphanothece hegewaldii CCALA 016]